MQLDPNVRLTATPDECAAAGLFLDHSGLRSMLNQLHRKFAAGTYLKQQPADTAQAYLEAQWTELCEYLVNVRPTFMTSNRAVETLLELGWAERYGAKAEGIYRWRPAMITRWIQQKSLPDVIGPVEYVKIWGLAFLGNMRKGFATLTIGNALSNEQVEELLCGTDVFKADGYGALFGREVQRSWTAAQAVQWGSETIPGVFADLQASHHLIAAMLIRIYTGTTVTTRLRAQYGNWRPGMAPRGRLAMALDED